MSNPYYYPYYSARSVHPVQLIEMNLTALRHSRLNEEQAQIEIAVKLRQEQINTERIRRYEGELQSKQRALQSIHHGEVEARIQSEYRSQMLEERLEVLRHDQYLEKVGRLEHERSCLYREEVMREEKEIGLNQKRQELQYQRKIEEYQQELLQKIQGCRSHRKQGTSLSPKKGNMPTIDENTSFKRSTIQQGENVVINKRRKAKQNTGRKGANKKSGVGFYPIARPGDISDAEIQNYQTIDVDRQRGRNQLVFDHSTRKKQDYSVYQRQKESSRHQGRAKSSIHCKSTLQNPKKTPRKQKTIQQKLSFLHSSREKAPTSSLQKIQNRLKLSSMVHKDSKLSHGKYEISHLINTYELEVKGRTQVKNSINNHPSILRRHALVITSR